MSKLASTTIVVPHRYPTATFFIDESGSKGSGGRFFVMGAINVRDPGILGRAVRAVRDRNDFHREFKFSEITRGALAVWYDLIDQLATSDARLAATVVNRDLCDPFPGRRPWEVQVLVATRLLVGCTNRRELVSVLIDGISTPEGTAADDELRRQVNNRLKSTTVVSAVALDSRASDLLQLADLTASAIAYERRQQAGTSGPASSLTSPKGKVVARLMTAFERQDFDDCRTGRVNIATLRTVPSNPRQLDLATAGPRPTA